MLCLVICKSRNGDSGNRMRGMIGTRRIKVRMRGTRVGTLGIKLRMWEVRVRLQGIREKMQGIGMGMWGREWN